MEIAACKEMLTALMDIGVVAMRVAKDHKVDASDVPVVMGLLADMSDFVQAIKDAPQMSKELADLSDDEIKELVSVVLKMFHTIKEA